VNKTSPYFAIWLVASAIAIFMAMQFFSAAFVDGQYLPVGNDSFYHARRILDAAIGTRGFYQFDNMIHVPEGSWINWPWAYDYLMAQALGVALWINPNLEPMAFLSYVPVAWVLVNFGMFTLIGRQIKLGAGFTAIALLGFALLPLNQFIHGVGAIDHHYFELTFVLATLLSGLRFFSGGYRVSDAVTLGIVLGIAPAFHNGLFILQIPILAAVFALWVRQAKLDRNSLHWLAGALVLSTLLISLPSAPFREMQFEFWTLSWFHLYVAASSAICLLYFGWRSFSRINLILLVVVGALLVLPMLVKILLGAAFLAGDLILLDQIAEVQSPASHLSDDGGYFWVARNYSWFIFLAPLYIVLFAIRAWRNVDPQRVYFSIFVVFGTLLMLTQFRLHPFGSWVLFLGGMLLVDELRARFDTSYLIASAASILILAIAFQPALRSQLFFIYSAGGTRDYAAARFLFPSLAAACSSHGGTVLSYSDDGHYIRYHTDCSVLTNNFLMTPLHEKKILEGSVLLEMTPEQFIQFAPDVRYIFVRMYGVYDLKPTGWQPALVGDVIARNSLLFVALTFSQTVPDGFRLIAEARVDDDRDFAYARVFEVIRDKEPKE
jgi:asparagine N-glycosylation enzyme membrane subunit Stt3